MGGDPGGIGVDPGGPSVPHHLQHSGTCSSAGNADGGMHTPGGSSWSGMGGTVSVYIFCINNDRISGRNPIWVQGVFTTIVWMIEWMGIYMNLVKTKSVMFTHEYIWV